MLAYALHINPLGHRDDVVVCFDSLPTRQQVIGVLASLAAVEAHPAGASMIAKCIEAIDQHGIPRLDRDRGRFEWRLQYPSPRDRFGRIVVETFDLYPAAGERVESGACGVGSEIQTNPLLPPTPHSPLPTSSVPTSSDAEAAIAALRAMDQRHPPESVEDMFERLGVTARLQSIVNNIGAANPKSLRFAAGMLQQLLKDLLSKEVGSGE